MHLEEQFQKEEKLQAKIFVDEEYYSEEYVHWLESKLQEPDSNVVNPLLGEGPTIDQYLDLLVTLEDEGLILTDNLNLIKHKPNNKFEIIIKKWIVGLST